MIQSEIERCFEEMTALKFEKLAEVKANYDVMIKRLKPDQHAEKIEKMKAKKDEAVSKKQEELDNEKKNKIAEIKERTEAKKKELQQIKDKKLEALQSQKFSRRRDVRSDNNKSNSRDGPLQTSVSAASTADISANILLSAPSNKTTTVNNNSKV